MRRSRRRCRCSLVLALLSMAGLSACGPSTETVQVRLKPGQCENDALGAVRGTWVALQRRPGQMILKDCRNPFGVFTKFSDLGDRLSQLSLEHVPEAGIWDLWVVGTNQLCCQREADRQALLCGVVWGITLPPPDSKLEISVSCLDRFAADKEKLIRECQPPLNSLDPQGLPECIVPAR